MSVSRMTRDGCRSNGITWWYPATNTAFMHCFSLIKIQMQILLTKY